MALVLVVNIVLCAVVFAAAIAVASWAIRGSAREGQPVSIAARRQWVRPTITLHRPARSASHIRPFEAGFDFDV